MRKDLQNFWIWLNKDTGYNVQPIRAYLIKLPFGYHGLVHRPDAGPPDRWCVSEYLTGARIYIGTKNQTVKDVVRIATQDFCEIGLKGVELAIKEVLLDRGLDPVNP